METLSILLGVVFSGAALFPIGKREKADLVERAENCGSDGWPLYVDKTVARRWVPAYRYYMLVDSLQRVTRRSEAEVILARSAARRAAARPGSSIVAGNPPA